MHLDCYDCVYCNEHTEETLRHFLGTALLLKNAGIALFPIKKLGISSFDDILLIHSSLPKEIAMDIIMISSFRAVGEFGLCGMARSSDKRCPASAAGNFGLRFLQHRIKAKHLMRSQECISAHL